ncbi:QWRF motif-containing protein 3-like [Gastrolobium bilobum]|uniref:QWRF motif-containing protein 3-like n=1 Tax=Gastrolobium bilobum TaxID=150636 RepID=UPI002AB1EF09|nr:QWRF motif-containing protein 3-like [Gastrolobium bilobum]
MKTLDASPVSSQSPKPRQHRNREVSSRFLPSSPPPSSIITTSMESGECHSPVQRKPTSPAADSRRHKITEEPGFMRHQLWPSSAAAMKKNSGTLADHISEDRIIEQLDEKTTKITSSISSKENDRPIIIGGSMRYLGTPPSSSSSSSSSVKKHGSKSSTIFPGRLSVDENAKSLSSLRKSYSLTNSVDLESEYGARKLGVEVPSRYMNDVTTRRGRRGTSDSNILNVTVNMNMNSDSPVLKRFTLKTAIKRANSLTGYKSSKSQWALSPGRSDSPVMSVESMDKPMSFSSLKHPTTPTKEVKGVEKFLNMGFDIFKSKKPLVNSPPIGFGNSNSEAVHQLRMLDNRFILWRLANARAQAVNENMSHLAQSNLIYAWDGITKLHHSVLKKNIQFAREKLQMKITFILYSQVSTKPQL